MWWVDVRLSQSTDGRRSLLHLLATWESRDYSFLFGDTMLGIIHKEVGHGKRGLCVGVVSLWNKLVILTVGVVAWIDESKVPVPQNPMYRGPPMPTTVPHGYGADPYKVGSRCIGDRVVG